jgi:hypothetical protein
LRKGGFTSWAYFRAPDGFALVTTIEALDANGQVLSGDARWSQNPRVAASLSFWQLLMLDQRPIGRYRVFVFLVTPQAAIGAKVTGAEMWSRAVTWVNTGLAFLPAEVRQMPVTPDHHLIANVYEFERTIAGETTMDEHANWPMAEQFASAGIVIETKP